MARTLVEDSGGTVRLIKRIAVEDSGGTVRMLRRAFVEDAGGVVRLVYAGGYIGTVTVGQDGSGNLGYVAGAGSISPTTDFQGNTVADLFIDTSGNLFLFLSANVAQSYFGSLIINGSSPITSASASSFTSGATSIWEWSSYPLFTFVLGNTYNWSYS